MGRRWEQTDEAEQFRSLYERHHAAVLRYARRRTREDVARDVVNETFLVAWRRLEDAVAGGLPWLYRTAFLVVHNQVRTEQRAGSLDDRLRAVAVEPASDEAAAFLARDLVGQALDRLPLLERELIRLTAWEGLSAAEAGAVVGLGAGAVRVRLHRARRRLRIELADERPEPAPIVSVHEVDVR